MADTHTNPGRTAAEQAAAWHARMHAPDVTDADRARFHVWLAADPAHAREYRDLAGLWHDIDAMHGSPEVADALRHAQAWRARPRRPSWSVPWRVRPVLVAGAAALGMMLVVLAAVLIGPGDGGDYRTALGEQRTVALADGSVVTLNTATQLTVAYSDTERRVELVAGQAQFDVVPDARKPFVVAAGGGEVRALGTVFDVYKAGETVTVTLLEGRVEVRHLEPPSVAPMAVTAPVRTELSPGQRVSYGDRHTLSAVAAVDVARATAWRQGKLDFHDTPLAEAIAQANRYSRVKLELADRSLADRRISGVFKAGNSELLAEGLQVYFGLALSRPSPDRIVLSPRRDDARTRLP